MGNRRIIIAGTGSGAGKTTVTLGLMAALKQRGLTVQGFKCGPDYIDPAYHTAITGRPSRNLDSWMLKEDVMRGVLARASRDADISIIEGVMGLYDGKSPTEDIGSTAEISILTQTPVVLVLNVQSMARSAAAVVKGFQMLNPKVSIVGVIANHAGSEGHGKLIREAVEKECGIPLLGTLTRTPEVRIPERHLGLLPAVERGELEPLFVRLGEMIAQHIDVDRLLQLADIPPLPQANAEADSIVLDKAPIVRIAVAKDAAFNFYYQENIEMLEAAGAECVFFSPLAGETVPEDVNGLYIGGGFPEEFAPELAREASVRTSIRRAIERGVPTFAECGGFMYLTEEIVTTDGESYHMVGVIPGRTRMHTKRAALGYREVTGMKGNFLLSEGEIARGHEFHYSTFEPGADFQPAYETRSRFGSKREGVILKNLVAGYTHLHFASQPSLVKRWISACLKYKENCSQQAFDREMKP
ncbi:MULTISPECIES: cobyrinate a,c-diamide synthase [Aneurinibacillus]|uniref:Cobyrinate a,c-diamide synthase n=1 Tax=Aneurinibacillus thermoaerophilus TaxID=143495 RepID=A0A1G8BEH6_ANETH|nr:MULTISPECIES: cobyrinate a,c-diamide synthase [Aneurinibacillus]AMA71415.1 cobyrinic acid a,c-diamide synthase [Aneurinibacillus sp. XH2]MED0676281.1 cobyrinate a,c-diamide synthase [Aneurinibacillus thermoaerophilus]MED0678672.1 cobyrinate a,c-diamide synthase [Aneurinibacillus thermoaerophilus]MED0736638.1 cobyrinate a,c-diamide synthase [Aneurinibacillus thermoaerophilus]MED0755816.1 cobyrinate a,c-diamide synthase [Aneurinibacillus thermoaerophilus]